jgi:hypothetical protein
MTLETELADPKTGTEGGTTPEVKAEDVETIARELGWKPETEWKGEPPEGGFASAADFIRSQGQHAKNLQKEMKKLKSETERRIEKIEKANAKSQERLINEIHEEYDHWIRKAIKEGDEETEAKLKKEKADQLKKAEAAKDEGGAELSEDEWVENFKPAYPELQKRFYNDEGHAWLLEDDADPDAMRLILDYVDSGVPFAEALEKASPALRKAYPDKYEDEEDDDVDEDDPPPRKNGKRMPVLASGGRGNGGSVSLSSQMTKAQREIGNRFVNEKLFASLEEYGEVLKANGRLGKAPNE